MTHSSSYGYFVHAYRRTEGLIHLSRGLSGVALGEVDVQDANRAAIVMGVSALDAYIHDLVVEAVLEAHFGKRYKTNSYKQVKVSIDVCDSISVRIWDILAQEIRSMFSRSTFQRSDELEKALRFVDNKKGKWSRIGNEIGGLHNISGESSIALWIDVT